MIVFVLMVLFFCFLVMKGWVFMGDVVSYVVLFGIVLVYIFGFFLILGVFGVGMVCVVVIGYLVGNSCVK